MKKTLLLIGIVLSTYLLISKWSTGSVYFCPTNGCDAVNNSKYSMIGNVPVSLIGIVGYVMLFNIEMLNMNKRLKHKLLLFLTAIGWLFSIYLMYVSLFYIQALCFYCMLSFTVISLLFFLYIKQQSKEHLKMNHDL
ncbi:vitamin K epoxide reductase family protein [Bacillus spizizenii]|uniref:Vitamin K epoxide reductase family protein n=1 Tax=Bacillus rugosus TaxID=2715209 RepID=A0ACD3ZX04_9BACI|nr:MULTISPECIES: vitamin K epoxide reductase family protein [Bacillus]APH66277.1 hypothetical protein BAX60_02000 [Bacillus subtilis]MBY4602452.1 vitamin K epoxide reductase family protein [Bacillus sp. SPARC3]MCY7833723.1 vitamin K epoxide reductase family protein [Bacillus spizizenii]MCY7923056.1 vitamin K epoxide reductase family protein [Bacillus spizizenii]MCY7969927.1 vitamin K epoxide reductase family protein [Bacillus spizizenii]